MDVISDESAAEFFDTMDRHPRATALAIAFAGAVGSVVFGAITYGLAQAGAHPGLLVGTGVAGWLTCVSAAAFIGGVAGVTSPRNTNPDLTP